MGAPRARAAISSVWAAVLGLLAVLVLVPSGALAGPSELPEGLQPPRVLAPVELEYPADLASAERPPAGRVVIKLTVGTDGVPHDLVVEQGVHPRLDELALQAASRLRYEPATLRDQPVEVTLRVAIDIAPPPPQEAPPAEAPSGRPPPPDQAQPPAAEEAEPATTPAAPEIAKNAAHISGQIVEAGQRTPVSSASIVAVPAPADAEVGEVDKVRYEAKREPAWQVQATSDETGAFELPPIPAGKIRVVVLAPGYERLEFVESVVARQELEVRYFIPRLHDNPYRTVVQSDRRRRLEVVRRTIDTEEIRNLPGTQGDALKAIQNFPGIARAPFGIGLLVIRGADPTDSAVYLGEHRIPQLFHFGGLTSVFNADVVTTIDYIPGNFDARYGEAIGGVIDVHTRPGRRDGYHGYIDSDLFDTGVLAEGPLGKGSFVLSGRRSYIDLLLPAVLPDDAGIETTVAPRYYDYQALFDHPVGRGDVSVKVFGSDDRTRLVAADPNDVETDDRNQFETTLFFHRFDLLYENHRDGWDFLVTPSYRYDNFAAGAGDLFRFSVTTHTFSSRAEVGRRLSRRLRLDVGAALVAGYFTIDAQSPPAPTAGTGFPDAILQTADAEPFAIPALFGTLTIGVTPRFTLMPGVRVSHFALLFERITTDPRLRFAWALTDRTSLRGGVGLYSQIPDALEWNRTFGNPRIGPEQALHTSLSVSHEFDHAITVEVGGFYKELWDLAAPSSDVVRRVSGQVGPESFANHGRGRIYGGEVFVRKALTRNAFGWVSYTLSRSLRRPQPGEDFILFGLDQTHILTLIGVYRLPRNWQIGARFRFVSGNPFTPVIGSVYDAGNADYIPIDGPVNSRRVAPFHQLDLRVDKRFVWRRVMLTTYLDIQNVYNHQNAEFINYSFDYTQRRPIASLPIIPSLGVRLEF